MNNIQIFNNDLFGEVRTMMINDNPWFVGKDIAEALGYKNTSDALKKHVDEDDKGVAKCDTLGGTQDLTIINESGVYSLIFGSKKPEAKIFKKWVTSEVLPTIRKSGCYITESATQETIDYQSKFGLRRIRKTIREAKDIIEIVGIWKDFKSCSKIERDAHRIDNDERIKCCKKIIDELQDSIANNVLEMNQYELPMYQGLMLEIQAEAQRLSNKRYGGKISNMTRKIKNLEQQLEDVTPYTGAPITLDIHGFTTNNLYTYDFRGERHRSYAYNQWRRKFRTLDIPSKEDYEIYESLDFTEPIGLIINFVAIEAMDADNMVKSFQDALAEHLGLPDDSIFVKCTFEKVAICDTYDEGKITFSLYQL